MKFIKNSFCQNIVVFVLNKGFKRRDGKWKIDKTAY